jgi:hypothetical protein
MNKKFGFLGMWIVILLTAGCGNTKQWTKALDGFNKALAPLVIFKKSK